ncbi:hypothetical protein ACIRU3_06485 [Streptomyces sp. NPDC101151]|uniref:hypothetical protein n=1 Tax=Streptomyces sp. NPDC101151 TaxID=3366115 RepID=UPI003822312B
MSGTSYDTVDATAAELRLDDDTLVLKRCERAGLGDTGAGRPAAAAGWAGWAGTACGCRRVGRYGLRLPPGGPVRLVVEG